MTITVALPIIKDSSSDESSDDSSSDNNGKTNIPKHNGNAGSTKSLLHVHADSEDDSSSDESSSAEDSSANDDKDTSTVKVTENKEINNTESSSSNSEDSDESSDDASSKQNVTQKKGAEASDKDSSDNSSDDSDDDSSEEENVKARASEIKKKRNDVDSNDSSSSDESDSDSEDEEVVENKINDNHANHKLTNGKKNTYSDSNSSEDDESDSESDDDEKDSVKQEPLGNHISQNSSKSDEIFSISAQNGAKRKANEPGSVPSKKSKVDVDSSSNCKLRVGNLSYNVDDDWLKQEFQEVGKIVDARVIYDESGRSRGFGEIELEGPEVAQNALKLDGKEIDGRIINVKIKGEPTDTIYVGNLSYSVDEDEVYKTFEQCGNIVSVRLPTHQDTGGRKGFGYVTFASVAEAQNAMELHETKIGGRQIRIDFTDGPQRGGRGGRGRGGGERFGRGGDRGDRFGRGGDRGDRFGRGGDRGDRFGRGGDRFGRGGDRFGRGGDRFGRGGRGGDRGRGGRSFSAAAANRGAIAPAQGKKIVFDQ